MTDKNGYIDIADLPGGVPGRRSRYPWREWEKLPPGKALEITDLVRHLPNPSAGIGQDARRRGLALMQRKQPDGSYRVFIYRKVPA